MTKPVKPIKFLEHIIHLMLIVPTGGVWLIVYLPRVFIKRIQIKNMSAEQNEAFEKLIDKTYFKKSAKDSLVPHVEMTYTKRIFASVAEAEDDPYYEFSEPYSFKLVRTSFHRNNLMGIFIRLLERQSTDPSMALALNKGELKLDCIMQKEPSNEYDEFAVVVFAEDMKIGNVSTDYSDAVTFYLDELKVSAIRVKGVISWDAKNTESSIGIKLDFNF